MIRPTFLKFLILQYIRDNMNNRVMCVRFLRDLSATDIGSSYFALPDTQSNLPLFHAKCIVEAIMHETWGQHEIKFSYPRSHAEALKFLTGIPGSAIAARELLK